MSDDTTDWGLLNTTELLTIARSQTGVVVKRSVSRERLLQIIESGPPPTPKETSGTSASRLSLQKFIGKNMSWLGSQLPCKGENRGVCTIYPCPEGRHLDCYMAASKQDI